MGCRRHARRATEESRRRRRGLPSSCAAGLSMAGRDGHGLGVATCKARARRVRGGRANPSTDLAPELERLQRVDVRKRPGMSAESLYGAL